MKCRDRKRRDGEAKSTKATKPNREEHHGKGRSNGAVYVVMATLVAREIFDRKFSEITAALRQASGLSQARVARRLGLSLREYQRYETSRPLRHELIPRFCDAVDTDCETMIQTAMRRAADITTTLQPGGRAQVQTVEAYVVAASGRRRRSLADL